MKSNTTHIPLWQNIPSFATCTFVYRTEVSRKKSYKCAKIQIKSHVPSCHFHMYETRLEIDNPCVTFFSVPFSVWRDDVERRRKFSVLYWSKGKTNPKTNISVINKSKWRRKFIDFFLCVFTCDVCDNVSETCRNCVLDGRDVKGFWRVFWLIFFIVWFMNQEFKRICFKKHSLVQIYFSINFFALK